MRGHSLHAFPLAALLVGVASVPGHGGAGKDTTSVRILVISVTPENRHASVPAGNRAIRQLGERLEQADEGVKEVAVDILDTKGKYADTPPDRFPAKAATLTGYDAIVFNNTSHLTLDEEQRAAFEAYMRAGGGLVGIHAAAEQPDAGSFFNRVLGATRADHASYQKGTIHVTDRAHPSTEKLPVKWTLRSTWSTFESNPRGDAHILMSADGRTHTGGGMEGTGHHHPMAWCQRVAGGRAWYTALGHAPEHFEDERFLTHLSGGLRWAAGLAAGDATGTVWDAYTKTPLATETKSPAAVEVSPRGRVFFVDRLDYRAEGREQVKMVDPETAKGATTVLELAVSKRRIYGLKDILLAPAFEDNGWVYLFYDPPRDATDGNVARLSRFTFSGGTIRRDSEVKILRIPIDPKDGHHAGHLAWGPRGRQLYVSIGDNVGGSNYAPLDEREGRAKRHDVQRTSGNSADLRGSILRIVPHRDGSYGIPADNLFTRKRGYGPAIEDGRVRPEIYVMGVRNPYRIAVDPATGVLYWGEYGPGAGSWNVDRGPPQIEEFNRAAAPGFYGYPFVIGKNIPFRDYDYAKKEGGRIFDPDGVINDSPNNTGLRKLPPAQGAMIMMPGSWKQVLDYPGAWEPYVPYKTMDEVPFPQLTGGEPIQGPVYRRREGFDQSALPSYYDGKVFLMERGKNWIKYVTLDASGDPVAVEPFLPDARFTRPIDMDVGPNGALYLAEWGSKYDGPNDDSGIYRIERTQVSVAFRGLVDGKLEVTPDRTATAEAIVTNRSPSPIKVKDVSLQSPASAGVEATRVQGTTSGRLASGGARTFRWKVEVPASAKALSATVTYSKRNADGEYDARREVGIESRSSAEGASGAKRDAAGKEDLPQVVIKADDQQRYYTDRFAVKAGERVRLTLRHVGELPVAAMGHNVVILSTPDAEPVAFAQRALKNGGTLENDYLPDEVREAVLAATDMVGGGSSTSVVFTAPEKPGEYPFLCTFPQHAVTMNGTMAVRKASSGPTR